MNPAHFARIPESCLLVAVGGNHEAINHLRELFYGGWVAPKMYFMGYAGVIKFGGLRFGGLSGIYNTRHYHMGHFERLPYTDSSKRSAYHVREQEIFRLKQVIISQICLALWSHSHRRFLVQELVVEFHFNFIRLNHEPRICANIFQLFR